MPLVDGVADIQMGQGLACIAHHPEPIILVEGPAGTSKTRGILALLLMRALACPGRKVLLARATRADLSRTVLATLEEQVFPDFGIEIPGGAQKHNRVDYPLYNGSVLTPLGADEGQKLYSFEWDDAYVAEALEFGTEESVTQLLRGKRPRPVSQGWDNYPQQLLLDCNPGPPGHWLNQRAEEFPNHLRHVATREDYDRVQVHNRRPATDPKHRWKRIVTKHQDNPGYWDFDSWKWTAAGQKYFDESLSFMHGHLRKRLVDGLWIAAVGSVYPEFDEEKHVIEPFGIPEDWPVYVGIDPGYSHPCAILWIVVAPDESLFIIDELYRSGMSIQQHAADMMARSRGKNIKQYLGDPQHCFSQTAQSPKTISQQFNEAAGIRLTPWPRTAGHEEAMVEAVRQRLHEGKLQVFSNCVSTVREFESWSYKRTASGELPPGEDKFEDRENHAMDVIKGVVASNPRYKHSAITVFEDGYRIGPTYVNGRPRWYDDDDD